MRSAGDPLISSLDYHVGPDWSDDPSVFVEVILTDPGMDRSPVASKSTSPMAPVAEQIPESFLSRRIFCLPVRPIRRISVGLFRRHLMRSSIS
jgi:hypothetical protein